MRKSIYYLIANALSTLVAAIFMGIVNHSLPYFNSSLTVTSMSLDCWEPMKIILLVLALSIIVVTRDVVTHGKENKDTVLDKVVNVLMAVITVVAVLYTWVAAILEFDNYASNQTISLPIALMVYYVVAIILMFLSPVFNKIKQESSIGIVSAAVLLIIGGIVYECVEEWYIHLIFILVALIIAAIPFLIPNKKKTA